MDEFEIPWEEGDVLVTGNWILIYQGTRESNDNGARILHVIIYHALCQLSELDAPYPYLAIGPRPGIGYFETRREGEIRYATNEEKDKFFGVLKTYKNAIWNGEAKQLQYPDGSQCTIS